MGCSSGWRKKKGRMKRYEKERGRGGGGG